MGTPNSMRILYNSSFLTKSGFIVYKLVIAYTVLKIGVLYRYYLGRYRHILSPKSVILTSLLHPYEGQTRGVNRMFGDDKVIY
jgi:hypothetical protein